VFTRYLIQGIQTGEADSNADGRITLDELYDYAYAQVVKATPKQKPHKWSFNQEGEIVVAKNLNPRIKPAKLPDELLESIRDPRTWVREGVVRELDQLLNGSNVGMALAAVEALRLLSDDDSRRVSSAATDALSTYGEKRRASEQKGERPTSLLKKHALQENVKQKNPAEKRLKWASLRLKTGRGLEQNRLAACRTARKSYRENTDDKQLRGTAMTI
jgi:hypothetical protein